MTDEKEQKINEIREKISKKVNKWADTVVIGGYKKKEEIHKVGDRWVDEDGKEWIQHEGYRSTVSKTQDAKMPWGCPKCGRPFNHRYDTKFYYRRGSCYNCVIEEDTLLMLQGKWDQYERKVIRANEMAFLRDHISEVKDYMRTFKVPQIHFQDGRWQELAQLEHFNEMFEKLKNEIQICETRLQQLELEEQQDANN